MIKKLKRNALWVLFAVFVVLAIAFNEEPIFLSSGPYAAGKIVAWVAFLAFLLYSLDVGNKESFFKALKRMYPILWSRQIGIDLYIGVSMFLTLMYINESSIIVFCLWLIPTIIYANLATLLYLALHYDSIVNLLIG